jgi:uncharacterized protein (DUF1778 family)
MTATRPNREREEILSIRLNADEKRMVQALADIDGLSLSDVARLSLRRAHAERFGIQAASRKKEKR